MPKKGDIVINPKTSRGVKVGSRTWLTLVKDGVLEGVYDDPNELYNLAANDTTEQIEQKRLELDNNLPAGKHAVKGRGKYKGKLVVRREQRASMQSPAELENFSDAEIDAKLQELLSRELMRSCGVQSPRREQPPRLTRVARSANQHDGQYELFDALAEVDDGDEGDDYGDDYEDESFGDW
jgi:hypothetical protein